MRDYLVTYSPILRNRKRWFSVKYLSDNLVMCGKLLNTHTHTHTHCPARYITNYFLIFKTLANPLKEFLLRFPLYFCFRNGAPPLREVVLATWHIPITALSVGIHRARC